MGYLTYFLFSNQACKIDTMLLLASTVYMGLPLTLACNRLLAATIRGEMLYQDALRGVGVFRFSLVWHGNCPTNLE